MRGAGIRKCAATDVRACYLSARRRRSSDIRIIINDVDCRLFRQFLPESLALVSRFEVSTLERLLPLCPNIRTRGAGIRKCVRCLAARPKVLGAQSATDVRAC